MTIIKELNAMSYYEIFQQGPAVYIPLILLSLAITLLGYSVFPIVFAIARKKPITKKKYNIICYCVNFFVAILFTVLDEKFSVGPYLLWTFVFSSIGEKKLKKRNLMGDVKPVEVSSKADDVLDKKIETQSKSNKIIILILSVLILVSIVVIGIMMYKLNLNKDDSQENPEKLSYIVGVDGSIYDVRSYERFALIRTLGFEDRQTAEIVFDQMKKSSFNEEEIIRIIKEFGGEYSGHIIEQGDAATEIDEWCFAPNRKPGDIAIIKTDTLYFICYVSHIYA